MSHRVWGKLVLFVSAALFLLVGTAHAQLRTTGSISGVVSDPSGASVPGATITVKDPSTGLVQTAPSNASGEYVFPALLPAAYEVSVTARGFATATYTSVVVDAGRNTDLNVKLRVGAQSQTVEVTGHGEVLETSSNTLATTIENDAIQNLPLNGRDILGFAQLVPGAQSGGQQRYTTFDGLPNATINITVDGMNDNFQRFRSNSTGFFVAAPARLGAMDEVTVSTNDLTADAGAEGSTQIRFVTKRGTNQFHGLAFWEPRNSYFNANSYTNKALGVKRPQLHQNDWGGSIGGPMWKNKLFFFFNYEELDVPGSTSTPANILTPLAQTGVFSYIGTDGKPYSVNLLTAATAQGFHGADTSGIIGGANGLLATVNGYATHGSVAALSTNLIQDQLTWNQPTNTTNRYPTARLDFQITHKVAWHGSWDTWWRKIAGTPPYPTDPFNGANQSFKSTYYTATNGVDWTISPSVLNQASFGILGTVEEFSGEISPSVFQKQGNRRFNTPLETALIPNSLPIPRNNPVWQFSDNLTYNRGNHTFTFGGDWRHSNQHETTYSLPPSYNIGLLSTDPAATLISGNSYNGNPPVLPNINTKNGDLTNAQNLYALLSGRLSSVSGTNNVNSITHQYAVVGPRVNAEAQTVGGLYMQDSWRATPHFALNYGFRWQFSGAIHNTNGIYTSPTLADLLGPSTMPFQPGLLTGITNPQIYLRPSPYKGDMIEPAPNVGFAWNPDFENGILGKIAGGTNLVIRGGASISHYDEGWITFESSAFGNPGSSQTVSYQAPAQFAPGSLSLDSAALPAPTALPTFPASFSFPIAESLFTFSGTSFSTVDPGIRSPYVESWNLGVQRKVGAYSSFEVTYVGNHAVHMWQLFDLNEVNIFENGFLQEFKNAQADLAANIAAKMGNTFSDQTGAPGLTALPILDAAFGVAGSKTADSKALSNVQGFQNFGFLQDLQQGQAGAMANTLAGNIVNGLYLCGMVGNGFSPCSGLVSNPGAYPINFFQANPFAAGRSITVLSDPGNETYNGLQTQFKHPVGHGLVVLANYTLSHTITDRYNTSDSTSQSYITLRDRGLNKGLSPYDLRHVARVSAIYDLPFGKGRAYAINNSVLNDVAGGWTVSTIVTLQSGRPFLLTSGFDPFNNHDGGVVLSGITKGQLQNAIGVYPGPSPTEPILFISPGLLNKNKNISPTFVTPPTTPGALGSFVYLHGPRFFDTDMALLKRVPIRENIHLNIRAEFLNVFNNVEWAVGGSAPAISANTQSSTFPAASVANSPRAIQFRLELAF